MKTAALEPLTSKIVHRLQWNDSKITAVKLVSKFLHGLSPPRALPVLSGRCLDLTL